MTTIVNGKMVRDRFGIRFWETISSGSVTPWKFSKLSAVLYRRGFKGHIQRKPQ